MGNSVEEKPFGCQEIDRGPRPLLIITKPIPFIGGLFEKYCLKPAKIAEVLRSISDPQKRAFALSEMVGTIDRTRVYPNVIGQEEDPTDILRKQVNLSVAGYKAEDLDQLSKGLKTGSLDIDLLLMLDDIYGNFIAKLKKMRSDKAEEFRNLNNLALNQANCDARSVNILPWIAKETKLEDISTAMVYHTPIVEDVEENGTTRRKITGIMQRICIPHLPEENRVLLETIVPKFFQRGKEGRAQAKEDFFYLFLTKGNGIGASFIRRLVEVIRNDYQIPKFIGDDPPPSLKDYQDKIGSLP